MLRRALALLLAAVLLWSLSALAFASEARNIRVGFFSFEGYHMTDENGARSGYGYEYLQEMAKYNNWNYKYYDGTWDELLNMLAQGKIDMLTSASYSKEREERFDYSALPIGTKNMMLTVRSGDRRYPTGDFESFSGMHIGMLKNNSGNIKMREFAAGHNFTYTSDDSFESEEELCDALKNGRIDGALTSNLRLASNERIVAEFSPSPYYVIVRKGDRELLQEVNYALENIGIENPTFQVALYQKYYGVDNGGGIAFTEAEQEYIAANPTVSVAIAPDLAPLAYFEGGEFKGIVADILDMILMPSGLKANVPEFKTYADYHAAKESRKFDVIGMNYNDPYSAEMDNMRLTGAYLTTVFSAVTRQGAAPSIAKVATLRDSAFTRLFLEDRYSESQLCYYDNYEDCIEAVRRGEAKMTLLNSYVAERTIYEDYKHELASNLAASYSAELVLGVCKESDPLLFSILLKSVRALNSARVNAIIGKHTLYQEQKIGLAEYIYKYPAATIFTLLLLTFVVFVVLFAIFIARRNKKELAMIGETARFGKLLSRASGEINELDLAREVKIHYSFDGGALIKTESEANMETFGRILSDNVIHPEDVDAYNQFFDRETLLSIAGGSKELSCELRIKNSDGSYRWNYITLHGIQSESLHPNSLLILQRDVDKIKREESAKREQLLAALNTAEVASNAKGNFMSRMSHEIRTPLNAIVGYMTIARNHINNPERIMDCLQKSEFASKHLISIINDVLDMSAIESGKLRIAEDDFNLRESISAISSIFYTQASEKGVRFEISLSDILEEHLRGDELRINQIIINLLSNSVKFTPSGGLVRLEVSERSIRERKLFLHFLVRDTGIGMTPDFLERLGKPFEQESASTARDFGGTGLGLSITKNLVVMMGGAMTVESTVGKGSVFTIDIPLDTGLETEKMPAGRSFADVNVLIVDDEEYTCDYTAQLFKNFGVAAEYATGGAQAVEMIRLRHEDEKIPSFDVCLMDWKMPDMDGVETIRRIREIVGMRMPIIVVTAYDWADIEQEALDAGVTMFVTKPLFQSTVFDLLMRLFGQLPERSRLPWHRQNFVGKRLLVAEDNELNLEIATEILSNVGFIIEQAMNGSEACEKFAESVPGYYSAILMDIQMPVMDGYEACRHIRLSEREDARSIPIIAMTANAFAEDISAALASGMDNHIAKPINVNQLFETLAQYV